MEGLVAWLRRLDDIAEGDKASQTFMQVTVPGSVPLDLDNWVLTASQYRQAPPGTNFPEMQGVIRLVDKEGVSNGPLHHRLAAELAAAISLATMRRVEVPYRIAATVQGQPHLYFLPYAHLVDRGVSGPLPSDADSLVKAVFERLFGLGVSDLRVIGASMTLFHSALLLFDRDVRSAYMLLVAGIEVLSRSYGRPPTDWASWELHEQWDRFIAQQRLSEDQAVALRTRLMEDRQLRLKATFRSYASSRLPASFWDQPFIDWMYGMKLDSGSTAWLGVEKVYGDHLVADFLTRNRSEVERSLGESYNVRSTFVHSGAWFGPLDLSDMGGSTVDTTKPLPFGMLRAILGELLRTELFERSDPKRLPEIRLSRSTGEQLVRDSASAGRVPPQTPLKKKSGKPQLNRGKVRK